MIIDIGTSFACEHLKLVVAGYIRDSKGRTGSVLLDSNGEKVVLQSVDYVIYQSSGVFKSITVELIDYAVTNNCRFFLYIKKSNQIWELDAHKIKNGYEKEKRYFRGINMYYLNLREIFIRNPVKENVIEVVKND